MRLQVPALSTLPDGHVAIAAAAILRSQQEWLRRARMRRNGRQIALIEAEIAETKAIIAGREA